jgi:ribosomal-protein-alanine N-acetyltransferase
MHGLRVRRISKRVERVRVTVEHATINHLRQFVNLERECFTVEAYTERQISGLLKDPQGFALLARVDDDIAGFIIGLIENMKNHRLGHVVTIDVALKYRRKGIGSILLREMEAIFSREGAEAAYLEVRVDNKSARQLYSEHGYREMGSLENYYSAGTHGLRMFKQLADSTSSSQS